MTHNTTQDNITIHHDTQDNTRQHHITPWHLTQRDRERKRVHMKQFYFTQPCNFTLTWTQLGFYHRHHQRSRPHPHHPLLDHHEGSNFARLKLEKCFTNVASLSQRDRGTVVRVANSRLRFEPRYFSDTSNVHRTDKIVCWTVLVTQTLSSSCDTADRVIASETRGLLQEI